MVELKLKEELSEKEIKKFKIPNTLTLNSFNGVQYCMCIGAITKDRSNKDVFVEDFSRAYINTDITPNKLMSFCELHKDIVLKDKIYDRGRFTTIYYVVYQRDEKPMIVNDFKNNNHNQVDIEIIFNDNGYYRLDELHLDLSHNTSIIGAIESLFSNENIDGLPFITTDNNNHYYIEYYDEYGRTKKFAYNTLLSIFNCITNIRLVGCREVE